MKRMLIIFSLIICSTLGLCAEEHKLSVTGNSSVIKPADQLTMILGVETYDKESKKAIADNAVKMNAVRDSLRNIGLSDNELETSSFLLIPQMTPAPKNPPEDWKSSNCRIPSAQYIKDPHHSSLN